MPEAEYEQALPGNCIEEINGNLICEDDGKYFIYARGIGWWAFDIADLQDAIRHAEITPVPGYEGQRKSRQ